MIQIRNHCDFRICSAVKSGSSRLKSDGGSGREIEVSDRGGPEVRQRYESGDLVRTWHRLMCHALAEVVSLISEGRRCRGTEGSGGTKGDFE